MSFLASKFSNSSEYFALKERFLILLSSDFWNLNSKKNSFILFELIVVELLTKIQWKIETMKWKYKNWFNPTTVLCLSQARTWIFSHMPWFPLFVLGELMWEVIACFADIGGIIDHHCLNFLIIMYDFSKWLH
jgi:hypothetical protein